MRTRHALWALALAISSAAMAQIPATVTAKRDVALERLEQVAPGVQVYDFNGKFSRVFGVPFGGGHTPADAFSAFVNQYQDLFSLGSGQLKFERAQLVGDRGQFTAGYYNVTLDGIPVEGARVTLLARNELGSPLVLAVNNAQTVIGRAGRPRLTASQAANLVGRKFSEYETVRTEQLVVLPIEDAFRLAYRVLAHGEIMGEAKSDHIWVDANSGAILRTVSLIHHVDITGTTKGWATPGHRPDFPSNPETLQNLPYVQVQVQGGNSAFSDVNGNFTIAHPGNVPVNVTAGLVGRWSRVVPAQGVALTKNESVTPPGPANLVFNVSGGAEWDTSQVNAYLNVCIVHDYIKAQNAAYPGVDIQLTTNVNQASTCNANFNGGNLTINFFAAGGGCPNTAYTSVVYHEYGHFVINRAGTSQGGYGEGMSDCIASLLMDTPGLGLEFRGEGTGFLRNAVNTLTWPSAASQPIHTFGMVISGAFWETLLELNNTIGHTAGLALMRSLSVNSILLNPPTIDPGITVDVLTLDDNDANLNNGTPHYTEIAAGFGEKGLTAPPVDWVTITDINTPDGFVQYDRANDVAIPFYVQITDNAGVFNVNTAKVHYRVNGGAWQETAMSEVNDPGFMWGAIAQPNSGSQVDWYISARDTQNRLTTFPRAGAAGPISFIIADGLTEIFADTFETDRGWVPTGTSLTSGTWQRGDPFGTSNAGQPVAPENDSGDPGLLCYVTQLGSAGQTAGAHDVDGGPATLTSPVFNLSGGDGIIEYDRWFNSQNGVTDNMTVQVSNNNGASWVTVETVTTNSPNWISRSFRVSTYVTPTNQVLVRFNVIDNPNDSVTEGGVDNVRVKRIIVL